MFSSSYCLSHLLCLCVVQFHLEQAKLRSKIRIESGRGNYLSKILFMQIYSVSVHNSNNKGFKSSELLWYIFFGSVSITMKNEMPST